MVEFPNLFLDSIKRLASEELASPNYIVPTLNEAPDSLVAQPDTVSLDTAKDALSLLIESKEFITEAPAKAINAIATGFVGNPLPARPLDNPLLVVVMLLAFFSFIYVIISRRLYVSELISGFFHKKDRLSIFVDSTSKSISLFNVNLFYLFIVSTSVTIYALSYRFGFEALTGMGNISLLACMAIPVMFLAMKACGLHFLNFIFKCGDLYIKNYFFLLYGLGIALYPVTLLLVFAPSHMFETLLIVSCVLCAIYVSLLIFKIFQIFFIRGMELGSLIYIMLYLCTFEILALLISLKLIMAW